ncbi:tetratricopeptide repeat-containing sensor histidine kinase [Flavobacterium caeni]|uniref:Tetratricopeptide repeat-containing protein n=1 Tax=Flavobacterium caeni TaxID=490189 RepID=A0A1G5J8E2_9FLAO|nr:histidine kinase [Flavobacterium caeni]SCY84099.1 Tetratricopeptide repeat-containing protein [Flavobacterium caeni]
MKTFLPFCRFWLAIVPVLFGCLASAQIRKGDAFTMRIDSLNRMAFDEPIGVIKTADAMLVAAKKNKRTVDEGLLLQVKGVAKTSLGHNTEALQYHMQSYQLFDSIQNNEGKILALINIATVHLNIDNAVKSREYLFKALSITPQGADNYLKTIYVNLGVSFTYTNDFRKSIHYYNKAIPCLKRENDHNGLAVNYHNIAACYLELKEIKNAEAFELRALEHYRQSGSKSTLAMISLELGKLYTIDRQLDKAHTYLQMGGKAAAELNSPYYRETHYEYLATWFEAKGDFKQSADYWQRALYLSDSIHSDETLQTSVMLEQQFQSGLQAKEIELLKVQKALDAATIGKAKVWRLVFAGFTFLCIALLFVLYRNYKLKQLSNQQLLHEKDQLAQKNLQLENENILVQFETLKNQVSPHFLFNSLNALASLINTDPQKAVQFTTAFSKIFRNALELKDRHLVTLAEELQHVNAYLSLQKMRFGDNLKTEISVPSSRMNDYLPPFSLQMVVENAIKHNVISSAEPLQIDVGVRDHFLVVTNNLQPRQFVEDSTGTGVSNIKSRYKYVTELEPVFEVRNQQYHVELPLIQEE